MLCDIGNESLLRLLSSAQLNQLSIQKPFFDTQYFVLDLLTLHTLNIIHSKHGTLLVSWTTQKKKKKMLKIAAGFLNSSVTSFLCGNL